MRSYKYLAWVAAVFVTCLIVANIIAVKLIDVGGLILPAAVIAGILGGDSLSWGGLAGVASFLAWFAAILSNQGLSGLDVSNLPR